MIITSTTTISAPIEKVWEILSDIPNYDRWNPFTPKIEVDLNKPGSDVMLHVRMNPADGKLLIQKEKLLEFDPANHLISWGIDGSPLWLKTIRIQQLTKIDEGHTRYFTSDEFHGVLTPLVKFFYGKKVQAGFDSVSAALKDYCESEIKS